ncbi:hypothetical protein ACERJO_20770 [Halalkalibacter sp. AB-rgal2]|uniref:hypothetical protein n=1 Tax=Halalkalibacter sp. AB-rgal2 TaxID=3242695 RepID=UPI00359D7AC2
MKLWNHYELENLNRDTNSFVTFLIDFMHCHPIEDSLEMVRVSGICLDVYTGRQTKLFKKVISTLKTHYTEDIKQIEEFVVTIQTINSIIKDFFDLRSSRGLNQIPEKRRVISFILSLEIMLGSLNEYIAGRSLFMIKQVYPYVFSLFDENKQKVVKAEKDINRILGIADSIAESSGSVLKFLGGTKGNLGKLDTMRMDHVRIAREHIELFDIWSTLLNLEQKWRFIGADFISDEQKCFIEFGNDNLLKAQEISKIRFKSQKNKWFADFNLSHKRELIDKIDPKAKELPPNQYLCEDEAYFSIAIGEFLHTHNLEIKCLGISLSEWIRAYIIIQTEAKKYIKERVELNKVKPLNLEDWTIVKSPKEWIDIFVSRGISAASAFGIIKTFEFTNDSKDLLDCPFVVHDDKLIVIPSVASHIDPSMSLISLFTKKNVDISFKGTGLEEDILRKLNKQGILAKRLKYIQDGETYECDAGFTLNNDLFLVELKAFGQPLDIREYYNFLLKINGESEKVKEQDKERSATEQLDRIVSFYESNLHLVKKELGLPSDWSPNNIYKIIVTTAMLGEPMVFDGCFVVDSSIFNCFLDRTPPGFSIGKTFLKPYHEDFEGEISSEKLINILRTPPQIELGNIRVRKNYRSFTLKSKTIEYPYYNDQLGDFIKYDKDLLRKMGLNIEDVAVTRENIV